MIAFNGNARWLQVGVRTMAAVAITRSSIPPAIYCYSLRHHAGNVPDGSITSTSSRGSVPLWTRLAPELDLALDRLAAQRNACSCARS